MNRSAGQHGGVARMMLVVLAIVVALAAIEFGALWRHGRADGDAPAAPTPATPARPAIGWIDAPADDIAIGDTLDLAGWALAPAGIRGVEVSVDGVAHPATYGAPREDVAAAHAAYPAAARSGWTLALDVAGLPATRHDVEVVAIDTHGARTVIGRRSVLGPRALANWQDIAAANPQFAQRPFWFLMATSGVAHGGAIGIETQYRKLESATMRIGVSVPILYMRTTRGKAGDFAFDPDFDLTRKCGKLAVADDNLDGVIAHAIAHKLPVNFILNGGIWGDASCESLDWDLTDHLQLDPINCQWDQFNEVLPDDYVKGLTGSTESPLLSRSLTYNVYARTVRDYKRRNLQAAARIIAAFAREHPDLFVGVNLDADTYMNPFVRHGRRYDYNPGMLRQFREWLSGSGPYAGHPADGAPDLRAFRRPQPLTLADVDRLAHRDWKSWSEVDPPREFPGDEGRPLKPGEYPYWQDPWYQEWDSFRKHVVGLHYAELAQWAHEAGIAADRIFTAQAFTYHDPGIRPISVTIDDKTTDYDSAGVSVEGAMPHVGHLGSILYGPSAENRVTMGNDHSLFANFARFDPQWAIVESNATDLKHADVPPTYARSYHSFRDLFNYGGRSIALMAWNGANGAAAGQPGYVAFTAFRNTPAEQAMMDFMTSHAGLPQGALLWTFGSPTHVDDDGWTATHGAIDAAPGGLVMHLQYDRLTLRSPPDQVIRPRSIAHGLVRLDGPAKLQYVAVYAKADGDDRWRPVARAHDTAFTFDWPADWLRDGRIVERIELELGFEPGADGSRLARVLLYPAH
jgi:Bacterial Ig domain